MKRRRLKEISTTTLRVLLILFFIIWMAILIMLFKEDAVTIWDKTCMIIVSIGISAWLSLITLSIIALLLHWKI